MDKYTDQTESSAPSFEDEVTRILRDSDRATSVAYDVDKWIVHVRCVDSDDAETARLEIVDELTETLGEEACEGLGFGSRVVGQSGHDYRIELEIVDEQDEEEDDDDDDGEEPDDEYSPERDPDRDDYLDRFLTLMGKQYFALGCIISDITVAAASRRVAEKGLPHLSNDDFCAMYGYLRRADTPTNRWRLYIDAQTNIVRRRTIAEEDGCIAAVAAALGIDTDTAKEILGQYSFDLDEREYPTGSFSRWYRHPRFDEGKAAE